MLKVTYSTTKNISERSYSFLAPGLLPSVLNQRSRSLPLLMRWIQGRFRALGLGAA